MTQQPHRPTILFVCYGGAHVKACLPIIKKLQAESSYHIRVLGLTSASQILQQHDIPHITFIDLLPFSASKALAYGAELAKDLPHHTLSLEHSTAYLGISFYDLIQEIGEEAAFKKYKQQGRYAFCPVSTFVKFLQHSKPSLVIATNSPRSEKAAIIAAGKCNIPSLCLVNLLAKQEIEWIGVPGYANKICVLNDYVKNDFIQAGRNPEDVIVTGNTLFDTEIKTIKKRKEPTILYASQPEPKKHPLTHEESIYPNLVEIIRSELRKLASKHPWHFIFKPHPSEKNIIQLPAHNIETPLPNDPIEPFLAEADIVIACTSSVGFLAYYAGKKLLCPTFSVFSPYSPYAEMGMATAIEHPSEFECIIKQAIIDKRNQISPPKRVNATNHIITEINKLLEEKLSYA